MARLMPLGSLTLQETRGNPQKIRENTLNSAESPTRGPTAFVAGI